MNLRTLILAAAFLGTSALLAGPNEEKACLKKAKEAQTAALSACSSKTGPQRKDCEKSANDAYRAARAACKK